MAASSTHHLSRPLDGAYDAHMRAATALETLKRGPNLSFGRLLLVSQKGGGRHDPAVDAVSALRHLLLDIGCLKGMRLVGSAEPSEGGDSAAAHRRDRCNARADRLSVEMDGAGAALRQAAAEVGVVQANVVAERVQQRHVRIDIDIVVLAVDVQGKSLAHVALPRSYVAA